MGIFNTNKLGYLGCWSPSLPASYDRSVSYLEMIAKLLEKVNEIIDQLNAFDNDTKNYVDRQIAAIKGYINQKIIELTVKHDADISDLNNKVGEAISNIMNYVDAKNLVTETKLKIYISDLVRYNGKAVYIVNPITGQVDSLQNVLNAYYDYIRYYAMTAIEYDEFGLTAGEYDEKGITAISYDMYGIFDIYHRFTYMISPFTGEIEDMRDVIYKLATFHSGAYTAGEYDAKEFTCTAFDNYDLTAFDWDFNGKALTS